MKDILDEMTLEEIKNYLRRESYFFINPIKKSKVLYYRWEDRCKILKEMREKDLLKWGQLYSKKRDEIAVKFNNATTWQEKEKYIKPLKEHDDKVKKLIAESEKIDKLQAENDKLYNQIDIERQKESKKQD